MNNVLEDSLFVSQNKKFDEIQSIVRQFSAEYVGNSIIKDTVSARIEELCKKRSMMARFGKKLSIIRIAWSSQPEWYTQQML